jgi:hypothetical protein
MGERLGALPIRRAFWFSIAAAQPDIAIHGEEPGSG